MIKFDNSRSNLEAVIQSLFFIESALKILAKFTKKITAKSYKLEVSSLTKIELVHGYFSTAFLSSKNPWAYFPEQASMVTSGNKAYNCACQKARQHTKFCVPIQMDLLKPAWGGIICFPKMCYYQVNHDSVFPLLKWHIFAELNS